MVIIINTFEFKDVIKKDGEEFVRKDNVNLYIDAIYHDNLPYKNFKDQILSKLMGVGSSGGFRIKGSWKDEFNVKYIVLFTTHEDIYWQDELDEELGLLIYYGDNKKPGRELHDTKLGGNKILKEVFDLSQSDDPNKRKKIPPFFLFEKTKGGVKFSGLLVPGHNSYLPREWLTAIWAKRENGGRFQNYKSLFSVLDISSGSNKNPNEASINLKWLDDLEKGKGYESEYAPLSWKNYIDTNIIKPLTIKSESLTRTKDDQCPSDKNEVEMLEYIYDYFKEEPTDFEEFAISITMLADSNIISCEKTRPIRDGGRDGIGEYMILNNLKNPIKTEFAVEAKCYNYSRGVGVKETSRLISRIRHRQFGVLVTTSFLSNQAYNEIIEDQHPIAIISGKDIIDILYMNDITNKGDLKKYLISYFPK